MDTKVLDNWRRLSYSTVALHALVQQILLRGESRIAKSMFDDYETNSLPNISSMLDDIVSTVQEIVIHKTVQKEKEKAEASGGPIAVMKTMYNTYHHQTNPNPDRQSPSAVASSLLQLSESCPTSSTTVTNSSSSTLSTASPPSTTSSKDPPSTSNSSSTASASTSNSASSSPKNFVARPIPLPFQSPGSSSTNHQMNSKPTVIFPHGHTLVNNIMNNSSNNNNNNNSNNNINNNNHNNHDFNDQLKITSLADNYHNFHLNQYQPPNTSSINTYHYYCNQPTRTKEEYRPIDSSLPASKRMRFTNVVGSSLVVSGGGREDSVYEQFGEEDEGDEDDMEFESNMRKRGRKPLDKQELVCYHCMTRVTPEWRRGPSGLHTLCNACGLKYAKILKKPLPALLNVQPKPGDLQFILNKGV